MGVSEPAPFGRIAHAFPILPFPVSSVIFEMNENTLAL